MTAPHAAFTLGTTSRQGTEALGELLAPLLLAGDVLVLSGDLGAGKTQLTKGIGHGLGVAEPITSPTFNLLLVHEGRVPLYHFDLYRLERPEQLEDLDYWGTLEADGVSVLEWGDRFAEALPLDGVIVRICITGDESRDLTLQPIGERGAELAAAWASAAGGGKALAQSADAADARGFAHGDGDGDAR